VDERGNPAAVLEDNNDITKVKQLEEQLRQSQKLEAIGQLAGGVAHDFNNLLTVIAGYSELLLERSAGDEMMRSEVEEITKAAESAASLTRQLLAFSRKQTLRPVVSDPNLLVSDVSKMLRRLIGTGVELVTVLKPEVGLVSVDSTQIEQVLMNLVLNARDAMPKGGKVVVETKNVELDAASDAEHLGVPAGRYVMLAVSDTGCGMNEETRKRIFEPFFTTKEVGKGTGLGLSTVYGIVKQSGGNILVYSEVGVGTTFKIYLPSVAE
jgi:signal transduction histidine kinase